MAHGINATIQPSSSNSGECGHKYSYAAPKPPAADDTAQTIDITDSV